MPASSISVDTASGQARFQARDVVVQDYRDDKSGIAGGDPTPVPAHVSFDVRWLGHGGRHKIRDKQLGFEGQFVTGAATISFTSSPDGGALYSSDPAGQFNPTSKQGGSGSPAVGRERNGRFFR